MSQQRQIQQAKRQRNLGSGDASLDNLSAAFFHTDTPLVTKIRGIIASAVQTGAGQWQLNLTQALPFGEYLAMLLNNTGALPVTMSIIDGNDTIKFLEVQVAGVQGDVNGISAALFRAFNN